MAKKARSRIKNIESPKSLKSKGRKRKRAISRENCFGKCGKRPTKEIPWSLRQMANTWYNMGRQIDTSFHEAVRDGTVRQWYCDKLRKEQEFCEAMKKVGKGEVVLRHLYPQIKRIPLWLPYEEYNYRMYRLFSRNYKWKTPKYKETCEQNEKQGNEQPKILKFTNSQNFVRSFIFPRAPTKGMLVYHQTGSGKTCAAVATASNFIQSKWSVLWVSRTSLLANVWKNIFEEVCESSIRGYINQGNQIPENFADRRKLLSKYWLNPVSFRTFSNAMRGQVTEEGQIKGNDLFKTLVARNGASDILRRTLIIFDEVHKIYGGDLKWQEKPDTSAIERRIFRSYEYSQVKDNLGKTSHSCKLLLMTATPITHDPMELLKILNLLIPNKEERFQTDYDKFLRDFVKLDGTLTQEFVAKFRNRAKGLISYLDRSKDPSQFAQIEYQKVIVPISGQLSKQRVTQELDVCETQFKEKSQVCKGIKKTKERMECKANLRKENKECIRAVKRRGKKYHDAQLEKYNELCKLDLS